MASLASITFELRLVIKIIVGILIGLFLIMILYGGGVFVKNRFFPDPPIPPDMALGKLPDLTLPSQSKNSVGFNVNTKTGNLPSTADRATVFRNKPFETSLTALQDTRGRIENLKFTSREEKISETVFRWTKDTGETISLDIYTKDFALESNFLSFPEKYTVGSFNMTKDHLKGVVSGFLGILNIDLSNFDYEAMRVRYYRISNNALVQVESQNEAQIARVDLFQKRIEVKVEPEKIETIPIFYPEYNGSTMHFFIGELASSLELSVVKAEFYQHIPNLEEFGTYPIISIQNALDDLKRGKGIVLTEKPLNSQTFQITDAGVAYYYGKEDAGFLYPVYVFYGSDFYAIVSALAPESISNETNGVNN